MDQPHFNPPIYSYPTHKPHVHGREPDCTCVWHVVTLYLVSMLSVHLLQSRFILLPHSLHLFPPSLSLFLHLLSSPLPLLSSLLPPSFLLETVPQDFYL